MLRPAQVSYNLSALQRQFVSVSHIRWHRSVQCQPSASLAAGTAVPSVSDSGLRVSALVSARCTVCIVGKAAIRAIVHHDQRQ